MSAITTVKSLQAAIKDVGRLREILVVLGKHGFGAAAERLGLHEVIGIKSLVGHQPDGQPFSAAERIRLVLEELGPTFIKLGQILSTRPDLIPVDVVEQLQSLQDDVPPMSESDVRKVLENELDDPVDEAFASFTWEPVASASVSQVHRAQLTDGRQVVVKVQRVGIAPKMASDISILRFLARRAQELIPELRFADPVGVVQEFDRAIQRELDFSNERRNLLRFERNFAEDTGIRIPHVQEALSTSRLLTLDFIAGDKIGRQTDPEKSRQAASRLFRAFFQMILRDGVFHADLHPGNILVEPDGRLGLIDLGLVGRLTRSQRDNFVDFLVAVAREDYEAVARVFHDIAVRLPGTTHDYGLFERDVTDVLERHLSGRSLDELDVRGFIGDLVTGAIEHRLVMPPTYSLVFKTLVTLDGIGKSLAPDLDLLGEAEPFVREVLRERYNPRRLLREGSELLAISSRMARQLASATREVLRHAEQTGTGMRIEVAKLDELARTQGRASQLQALSILAAGSTIAGALVADAPVGSLFGLSVPSVVLFGVALAAGVPALLSILRS